MGRSHGEQQLHLFSALESASSSSSSSPASAVHMLISATKQNKTKQNKQTIKQSLRKAPDVGDLNL
jgi:hypothetical protein